MHKNHKDWGLIPRPNDFFTHNFNIYLRIECGKVKNRFYKGCLNIHLPLKYARTGPRVQPPCQRGLNWARIGSIWMDFWLLSTHPSWGFQNGNFVKYLSALDFYPSTPHKQKNIPKILEFLKSYFGPLEMGVHPAWGSARKKNWGGELK